MTLTSKIETIIAQAARDAIAGNLSDSTRVALYRLALTAAANEFYRIEENAAGIVSPEALLLIQQIALLCDDNVDADRLIEGMKEHNGICKEDSG